MPNTTPTPNELYNGEMKKMSDTELRVVLIVTRSTLGWEIDHKTGMRKQEDWISNHQLREKTGRGGRAISTAIDNCIKKEWIEARNKVGELLDTPQKRSGKRIYYRLGNIFLSKITSAESAGVEKPMHFSTPTSAESAGAESALYKRNTFTKETIQNIAKQSFADDNIKQKKEIDKVIDLFKDISPTNYKDWFGNKTERKASKNLLEYYSLEQLEKIVGIYLPKINTTPYNNNNSKAFSPWELNKNIDKIKAKIISISNENKKRKSKVKIAY